MINIYNNFDEKQKFFKTCSVIDTQDSFINWYTNTIKKCDGEARYLNFFRGVKNAEWKLYNSLQRHWDKNVDLSSHFESQFKYQQHLVLELKKTELFKRVIEAYRIPIPKADFLALSILQHYRCPTLLLDWTYDLDIALFFATDRNSDIGTFNYFSIYHMERQHGFTNLRDVEGEISLADFERYENRDPMSFFISDYIDMWKMKERLEDRDFLISFFNLNIIAQKGLFIYNPNPNIALEEVFSNGDSKSRLRPFDCINVHKNLIPNIRKILRKKGVVKSLVEPNLKSFVNRVMKKEQKLILETKNPVKNYSED